VDSALGQFLGVVELLYLYNKFFQPEHPLNFPEVHGTLFWVAPAVAVRPRSSVGV